MNIVSTVFFKLNNLMLEVMQFFLDRINKKSEKRNFKFCTNNFVKKKQYKLYNVVNIHFTGVIFPQLPS